MDMSKTLIKCQACSSYSPTLGLSCILDNPGQKLDPVDSFNFDWQVSSNSWLARSPACPSWWMLPHENNTGELGYDGPLYDRLLPMTDHMLGPSPMHIKYVSCKWGTNFPGPIESVISKVTCIANIVDLSVYLSFKNSKLMLYCHIIFRSITKRDDTDYWELEAHKGWNLIDLVMMYLLGEAPISWRTTPNYLVLLSCNIWNSRS